jgi:hypothetical protein
VHDEHAGEEAASSAKYEKYKQYKQYKKYKKIGLTSPRYCLCTVTVLLLYCYYCTAATVLLLLTPALLQLHCYRFV